MKSKGLKGFPKTMRRSVGGSREGRVRISSLVVPDLFIIAEELGNVITPRTRKAILECWHLSLDMWRLLQESAYGTCSVANDRRLKAWLRKAGKRVKS